MGSADLRPQHHRRSCAAARSQRSFGPSSPAPPRQLFAETLTVETEAAALRAGARTRETISCRAGPWRRLGLAAGSAGDPSVPRLMRFDLHPTDEGWRLSEVNSDVPGGLNESSLFPELWPARAAGWGVAGASRPEAYVRGVAERHWGLERGTRVALGARHRVQRRLAAHGVLTVAVRRARRRGTRCGADSNVELRDGAMRLGGVELTVPRCAFSPVTGCCSRAGARRGSRGILARCRTPSTRSSVFRTSSSRSSARRSASSYRHGGRVPAADGRAGGRSRTCSAAAEVAQAELWPRRRGHR